MRMVNDEIEQLVERARSGDRAAFAALYDVFAPRIYRYFRFRVSAADVAEDLTQKVFLKMVEHLPKYESRGLPFAAWVFRVARNAWIDADRSNRPAVDLDELIGHASDALGPDELAATSHEHEALRRAVAGLPSDQRDVIAYRFFADLTPGETAAQMRRTEGSVRVLQHRALAALRLRIGFRDGAAITTEEAAAR